MTNNPTNRAAKLTVPTVNRILNRLRTIPTATAAGSADRSAAGFGFWAKITGTDDDGSGTWKMQLPQADGTLADSAPAITGTRAYTTDGSAPRSGPVPVRLWFGAPTSDGHPTYIYRPVGEILIPVTLTVDGSGAGDATHTPSYTYKNPVNAITGVEEKNADGSSATGLSPTWARNVGEFSAGTNGLIYRNSDGNVVLFQVDETEVPCGS